jgi:hypothetical protein
MQSRRAVRLAPWRAMLEPGRARTLDSSILFSASPAEGAGYWPILSADCGRQPYADRRGALLPGPTLDGCSREKSPNLGSTRRAWTLRCTPHGSYSSEIATESASLAEHGNSNTRGSLALFLTSQGKGPPTHHASCYFFGFSSGVAWTAFFSWTFLGFLIFFPFVPTFVSFDAGRTPSRSLSQSFH